MFCKALLCAAAVAAGTQESAMARNPVDVLRESNEGIRRVVLDNGLVVLLKEDRSAEWVAIQYWVKAGSIHEGERLGGGLSHYLEHMVFKGTPTREPGRISKDIADAGGDINAYTSMDRTVFHAALPAAKWRTGLATLTDAVFHPNFPEEEWAREREVILRECDMNDDNPDRVLSRMTWETAYQAHPYRVPVIGWRDILTTMGRGDLADYHRAHYSPHNMILAVCGAVGLDEMEAAVREEAGREPRTPVAPAYVPQEPPQQGERRAVKTGPYRTLRMEWSFHTTRTTDADTPALDVLAAVVGSGRSSRLVKEFREERRLAHAIEAYNYTPQDPGLFGIGAECAPEKAAELEAGLREAVAGWATADFGEAELERARQEVLTWAVNELATMEGQAAAMASGEFYEGNPRRMEGYLRQVEGVSADDLRRVAAKWLREENGTWAILAPEGWRDRAGREAAGAGEMRLEMRTLANGVRVVTREDPRLPLVAISVVAGGGQLAEESGKSGLAALSSQLLTRGTARHTAAELAERLERRGVSMTAFSGRNTYGLELSGLAAELGPMLETAAECWRESTFPEDETAKARDLQAAAIRNSLEKPTTHASRMVLDAFFAGHPFHCPPSGDLDEVERLSRDDAAAYHRRLGVGANLVVAVFGDIRADEAAAAVERLFGGLEAGEAPVFPELPPPPEGPVRVEKTLPYSQTVVIRAWPGIATLDPRDLPAALLADSLSGLSSDLFVEVRDKRGLAYYTGASQFQGPVGGLFQIYAGTTEEGLGEVERQIGIQTDRLRGEGLRRDEFDRGVAQLLADDAQTVQLNATLARECAIDELQGLGYRHPLETAEHLKAVTPESVRAAAESLFDGAREVTAVVHSGKGGGEEREDDGDGDGGEDDE